MFRTLILPTFIAVFLALSHVSAADVAPTSDTPKQATVTTTNPNPDPDAKNAPRPQEQGVETPPENRVPVKSPAVTSGTSYQKSGNDEPVHHDQNIQHVEPPHHDPAGNPVNQGSGANNPFVDTSKK